jgi:hypothetical protein
VTVRGPFPFATGMLQLLSAPLARRSFHPAENEWTRAFAARARGPLPYWRDWQCQSEDVTVGYAVYETIAATSAAEEHRALLSRSPTSWRALPAVDFFALRADGMKRPLIADAPQVRYEGHDVAKMLAIHHFEPVT